MYPVLKQIYRKIFPDYPKELEKITQGCTSLLDVGCGAGSPIRFFSKNFYSVGVDSFLPSIQESKKKNIHNKYHVLNILEISNMFKRRSFDCVLASDVIEHLSKEEGYKLLYIMETIAKKKVIVFTPNGFLPQMGKENPRQEHQSGWTYDEMKTRGYRIYGVHGWKPLRSERAHIRYRPYILWNFISDVSQHFVKFFPKRAFHLLCIKEIHKE